MNDRYHEALSSLIDGYPVDPGDIAEALELPDGRRLLVDFAALRTAVGRDAAEPSAGFYARMQSHLAAPEPHEPRRFGGISVRVAAASVAAALLLGFGVDSWRHRRPEAPPTTTRVLRFEISEWTSAKGAVR
jgi:hypothetical protein